MVDGCGSMVDCCGSLVPDGGSMVDMFASNWLVSFKTVSKLAVLGNVSVLDAPKFGFRLAA
jgi:hypothetical protein